LSWIFIWQQKSEKRKIGEKKDAKKEIKVAMNQKGAKTTTSQQCVCIWILRERNAMLRKNKATVSELKFYIKPGADAIKTFTPSLGIPYLGV